jgi:hypothetical protein
VVAVLKLAILILCIKHVLDKGQPAKTAAIYAGVFLVVGIVLGFMSQFTIWYGAELGITFIYDLLTGLLFFWLIERYRDNLLLFYLIIIFAIAASFAIKVAINLALVMSD